jgi:hypothetical protein
LNPLTIELQHLDSKWYGQVDDRVRLATLHWHGIYALVLPFNFLEHPSMRIAINTTADMARTLRPIGVPRRSGEFRCCRAGV